MSKAKLREQLCARLQALTPLQRFDAALRAAALLQQTPFWSSSNMIMLYAAQVFELDTAPLIETAWASGKGVCLPVLTDQKRRMEARFLTTLAQLIPNRLGILEPNPAHCPVIEISQIDLILVPGLAFDRAGNRLGRGGGYYDAFLKHPQRNAVAIGWFFACQELPAIPREPHDHPLDAIITENEVINIKST